MSSLEVLECELDASAWAEALASRDLGSLAQASLHTFVLWMLRR